jgi:eukaryotic-like serine/threonine-protein kinase
MATSAEPTLLAGRYRLVKRLGSGGMATVFLAEDERLGRRVAVKRLHADSPEDTARRFAREARIGASLNHPNLVTVFDTVSEDETVLIVMEYVEGESLGDALKRGPLDQGRAASVVRGVAAALDHAHEQGVVHRDVKPANILLGSNDTVKLVDLGIATALEGTQITASGSVVGTAAYMAPEQLDGRAAGPRADVYALGIVAYEMLSGRRAYRGGSPIEIAHQVMEGPKPDLLDAWPTAPPAAAAAIERATAFDPEMRQATAGEFAGELSDALAADARESSTGPTVALGDRRRERRVVAPPIVTVPPRRRLPLGAIAAVAIALLAVAAVLILTSGGGDKPQSHTDAAAQQRKSDRRAARKAKAQQQQQQTTTQQTTTQQQQQTTTPPPSTPQPTGHDPAEGARLQAQGHRLIEQGNPAAAIPVLQKAVASFPPDTTDLNYAYALFDLGHALRLAGRPADAIPVLEKRLQINNQRGVVEQELKLAREQANGKAPKGKGHEPKGHKPKGPKAKD